MQTYTIKIFNFSANLIQCTHSEIREAAQIPILDLLPENWKKRTRHTKIFSNRRRKIKTIHHLVAKICCVSYNYSHTEIFSVLNEFQIHNRTVISYTITQNFHE